MGKANRKGKEGRLWGMGLQGGRKMQREGLMEDLPARSHLVKL